MGSGAAGLRAAVEAARLGQKVLIVCKSNGGRGSISHLANGGFRAAREGFSPEEHFRITLRGGRLLNDRKKVQILVEEALGALEELRALGLPFHKEATMLSFPGGGALMRVLEGEAARSGVKTLSLTAVVDLLSERGRVGGALVFDLRRGEFKAILARAVILATGGAGALYRFSNNPPHATGDGYALGLRAGARLLDMEFVQFYPLGAYQGKGMALLIKPILGNLGVIRNRFGEDILVKHGVTAWPAASVARDFTSRAIFSEIEAGAGVEGALLLDLRELSEKDWGASPNALKAYPLMRKKFRCHEEPVRIIPVCHHTMGGICTDEWGATGIDGLYAAGEAMGGVHGANRLGGNAIPEAIVFGARAARAAASWAQEEKEADSPTERAIREAVARAREVLERSQSRVEKPDFILDSVRKTMWEKVGVVRSEAGLREALAIFEELERDCLPRLAAATPREFLVALEARTSLLLGGVIASSALRREESRGSHYRSDLPDEKEEGLFNQYASLFEQELRFEAVAVPREGNI